MENFALMLRIVLTAELADQWPPDLLATH